MILTINAGSSSLKCAVFTIQQAKLETTYRIKLVNINSEPLLEIKNAEGDIVKKELVELANELPDKHLAAFNIIIDWLQANLNEKISIIGHRVVHGGDKFYQPTLIDNEILHEINKLIPLAPLHLPFNLMLINTAKQYLPTVMQVACFDTAFHQTQPKIEREYALPQQYTQQGIKRYGFHGLSYEYITQSLKKYGSQIHDQRNIVAHLGSGASLCAIKNGKSIATTMGFTPLDGIPMGTRCGQLDPGVVTHLMRQGHNADQIDNLLYKESGWLGVSSISNNMEHLINSNKPAATFAIDMFCYRISREIGSLAATLNGLDNIIFTGGIGENSSIIRGNIAIRCLWLNTKLDSNKNKHHQQIISTDSSQCKLWVIPTNEEKMIAQHCLNYLNS